MGKIRVKTLGDEEAEKQQKEELKKKKEARLAESKQAEKVAGALDIESGEKKVSVKASKENDITVTETAQDTENIQKPKASNKSKQQALRSKAYQSFASSFDPTKNYSLNQALEILKKLQRGKFDETVELHINTFSSGLSGNVTLPHGTGKKTRVAIATDSLIAEVEKSIINFDVLVSEPSMMPKLAKVARVLGPKGLMPNPKNGTISQNPQEMVKKYEGGQISFKTEGKFPILHLTVGKISFGDQKLSENIQAMVNAVKKSNIRDITLKSTMSPGIKISL